ncbi:hypothetical protein AAMO2058_001539300 [Amorphochlora amoebiformis]
MPDHHHPLFSSTENVKTLREYGCKVGIKVTVTAFAQRITVWESEDVTGYGGTLWQQAIGLTHFLLDPSHSWQKTNILELGCGLGLVAIAAAKRGANVIASDRQLEALALAEENSTRNKTKMMVRAVDWVNTRHRQALLNEDIDLVLGAAVIYHIDMIKHLVETIKAALRPAERKINNSEEKKSGFVLNVSEAGAKNIGEKNNNAEGFQVTCPVALITVGNEKQRELMFRQVVIDSGLVLKEVEYEYYDEKSEDDIQHGPKPSKATRNRCRIFVITLG